MLPLMAGLICFGNHYIRDSVGALEKQLEQDMHITTEDYALLNSLFFIPNIFTPVIAGILCKYLGGPAKSILISVTIANIGHFLFCYGINIRKLNYLIVGRFLAGTMYEVIDVMTVIVLGPFYSANWGTVVGMYNSFLRLGSVSNFVVSPYVYEHYGLAWAFWIAFMVVAFGNIFAIGGIFFEKFLVAHKQQAEANSHSLEMTNISQDISQSVSSDSVTGDMEKATKIVEDVDPNSSHGLMHSSDSMVPHSHSNSDGSFWDQIKEALPFYDLTLSFYLFALSGAFLYGSMVPFWFMGSKFLQNYYGLSVTLADTLMLVPEGAIVFLSLPVGFIVDYFHWSMRTKLKVLSYSIFMLPVSYCLLVMGSLPQFTIAPIISVSVLGLGYGLSNSLFWSSITGVVEDPSHLSAASGLVASMLNILPAVIPPLVEYSIGSDNGRGYLTLLSIVGTLGSISALCSSLSNNRHVNDERNASQTTISSSEETLSPLSRIDKSGTAKHSKKFDNENLLYESVDMNDNFEA